MLKQQPRHEFPIRGHYNGFMDKEDVLNIYERISFIHKREENSKYRTTWIDFEGVMQIEISQAEKDKYYMISHICET